MGSGSSLLLLGGSVPSVLLGGATCLGSSWLDEDDDPRVMTSASSSSLRCLLVPFGRRTTIWSTSEEVLDELLLDEGILRWYMGTDLLKSKLTLRLKVTLKLNEMKLEVVLDWTTVNERMKFRKLNFQSRLNSSLNSFLQNIFQSSCEFEIENLT